MDTLPLVAPEQVGLSAQRLDRVRKWMNGWVDSGRLAGMVTAVMRRGELAFAETAGKADVERNKPMRPDTIFRIYSMTKPLTSTAIMMLYEEGRFQLDDPISKFIPRFANPRVYAGGSRGKIDSVPAEREITFRDLLTHTSGLTYGFMESNPVDALYRSKTNGVDFQTATTSLKDLVERLATLPADRPAGQGVELQRRHRRAGLSGRGHLRPALPDLPQGEGPRAARHGRHRLPCAGRQARALRRQLPSRPLKRQWGGKLELIDDPGKSRYLAPRAVNSGGGGLVSTAADYLRFCRFMLNKGELDGTRLLGRKTVELMTMNHLKGDMADMGMPRFSESTYYGVGFGLGFSVMIDPAKAHIVGTAGEYAWGGAASTAFWCDPAEDMAVVLLTQLMPSSTYPIRRELRVLTYQAIVD